MKQPWGVLLMLCGVLAGYSAFADHQVDLRGIVNLPGQHVAVLQIDRENWVGHVGDHLKGGTRDNYFPIEVLEVDLTNEIVKTRIDGEDYTNSLPAASRPATAESWIHLQDTDFQQAMNIFGNLSGRTILLHPAVSAAPFSCEASWTGEYSATNEIIACFAKSFNERDTATLEDGDCFLQIIPASMAQTATLGAKDLPTTDPEQIRSGVICFRGIDISQAINIYGKLLGRERKNDETVINASINFLTTSALSKAQVIYALETLFRWNGAKIILNDDNTFSVAKI